MTFLSLEVDSDKGIWTSGRSGHVTPQQVSRNYFEPQIFPSTTISQHPSEKTPINSVDLTLKHPAFKIRRYGGQIRKQGRLLR